MSQQDLELCRGLLKVLKSEKNSKFNALFLFPFDIAHTPGYLDICGPRVMDLSTLSQNLENGRYCKRKEVYDDCNLIFENAMKYHSDKDTTKWIVSPAKNMLQRAKREQQKIEKKLANGTAGVPKLKLKIKQPAARATGATISRGKTAPVMTSSIESGTSSPSKPPPSKKPRLTLKLGLHKPNSQSASGLSEKSFASNKKNTKKAGNIGGPSRGKELPKGVKTDTKKVSKVNKFIALSKKNSFATASKSNASKSAGLKSSSSKSNASKVISSNEIKAAKATQPKTTKTTTKSSGVKKEKISSKAKLTLKTSSSAHTSCTNDRAGGLPMTPARKAQCSKILNGIKRRKAKSIVWFEKPVSDKKIIQDYKAKIKYPMDLSTIQSKLDNTSTNGINNKGYLTVADFVLDLRRIFSNCLRYNNSNGKDSLRPIAVDTLGCIEQLASAFLAKPELSNNLTVYPPLLFCWKLCVNVIDTLYNLTNREDKHPTAFYFMHPVEYYFGGMLPADYLQKAPKPMDFGTITSQLLEGQYTKLDQFESDCKLVISNCLAYYGGKAESAVFCDHASRLSQVLQQQLDALNRYVKSSAGVAALKSVKLGMSTSTLLKPPISLLLSILAELRDQKYVDKLTKIVEPAMANFEKPVSVAVIPDYMQYVQAPMDLQTVERKIRVNVQYITPEDFEYDMILMFQNCITYNSVRKVEHLVALGRFGLKSFRRIFNTRMSTSFLSSALAIGVPQQSPQNKTMDLNGNIFLRGKAPPRISLSAATLSEAQRAATAAAQTQGRQANRLPGSSSSSSKEKPYQPVPLHIAIAQVKERYPLRRDIKSLQSWEAACGRFFKELKRHPWISAARPKFIFHVPVPVLFPELREAYGAKIKKPMDLTTAECSLLAGNKYTTPEDFVNDVALVFTNAIYFNKDGRDVGDALSCAYYDASIHLLKYSRWLSMELLSDYVIDSDYVDEPEEEGIPVQSWKLTEGNVRNSRREMEAIVLNEPIEKTLEGERYSWMESEGEKLLKSLRLQSDLRYMTFFLLPNYPPDYSAFINRPMDWEKVQKTLKKRNYDNFASLIEDTRLIFSNALKYNARLSGTDTVSGRAYDSAKIMSAKLEKNINKLLITVSDRVERERIDHNNDEREIEANERVEEARIRAQWNSDSADGNSVTTKLEGSLRIRSSIRLSIRKSDTDFEVPFFDEEYDGQHEQSYVEVMKQQKVTFERQRSELVTMRRLTKKIGLTVFDRIMKAEVASVNISDITLEQKKTVAVSNILSASSISGKLAENGRHLFEMSFRKKNVQKEKKTPLAWDDDDDESDS